MVWFVIIDDRDLVRTNEEVASEPVSQETVRVRLTWNVALYGTLSVKSEHRFVYDGMRPGIKDVGSNFAEHMCKGNHICAEETIQEDKAMHRRIPSRFAFLASLVDDLKYEKQINSF